MADFLSVDDVLHLGGGGHDVVVEGGDVEGVAGEVAGEGFLDDVGVLVLGGDLFADLRDLFRVGFSHSVDPGLDLEVCHADDEPVQQPMVWIRSAKPRVVTRRSRWMMSSMVDEWVPSSAATVMSRA